MHALSPVEGAGEREMKAPARGKALVAKRGGRRRKREMRHGRVKRGTSERERR